MEIVKDVTVLLKTTDEIDVDGDYAYMWDDKYVVGLPRWSRVTIFLGTHTFTYVLWL